MNVFDTVRYQARVRPHAVALIEPDRVMSYASVVELVLRFAGGLRRRGIGESDVVALQLGNSTTTLLLRLALARLGAVAVNLPLARKGDALAELVRRFSPKLLIATDDTPDVPGTALAHAGSWLLEAADADELARPDAPGGERLYYIALTSGTTGAPKAIGWSHARTLEQLRLQREVRPLGPGVRFLPFMGLEASVAGDWSMRQLFSGGAVVVVPNVSYETLCDCVDRLGATQVLTSPGIIGRLLARLPAEGPRFPTLTGLRLAGGLVSPQMLRVLQRRLTPNLSFDYGSSEVGALAIGDPETVALAPQAVGRLVPWVRAEAVGDDGRTLPPGESGVLRFRGTGFPRAYLDEVREGSSSFDGDWFRPGDYGYVAPGDLLVVQSRVDDILNVGGVKVMTEEVERVIGQHPGVVESAAYAVTGPQGQPLLIAAVVVDGEFDEGSILQHCRHHLGARAPARLVRLERLPRSAMGKVLRQELVDKTRIS